MPALRPRTIGVIFLLINVAVWGVALPIVKPALSVTTPFQFLLYRYVLAAILSTPILVWYLWRQRRLIRYIPRIVGIELLGTVLALSVLYEGLDRTSSLEASLIVTTLPFFLTLGGIIFLHEKEEKREWIGLGLALSGTLFLAIEPLLDGQMLVDRVSFSGNALVVAYNFIMAAALLLAKKYYQKLPKFFVTTISFYVGMVCFAGLSMFKLGLNFNELVSIGWQQLQQPIVGWSSLYMATFGSIIGLTAYIIGQNNMEASEAGLFTYLEPIFYVPLAVFFLHEPVTPGVMVALALVALGVWWAELRGRGGSHLHSTPGGLHPKGRVLHRYKPVRRSHSRR